MVYSMKERFGYYFHTGPVVKQAREMGMKTHIMGEEGADSPKFPDRKEREVPQPRRCDRPGSHNAGRIAAENKGRGHPPPA